MNQASLDDLNQRMTGSAQCAEHGLHGHRHVTSMTAGALSRFRPNLLVGGPGMGPYAEDSWQDLQIGSNTFHAAGNTGIVSKDLAQQSTCMGLRVSGRRLALALLSF